MNKKLGIYCRISGDKQGKTDYSIDTQKQLGRKLAESYGWLYKEYIDEGKSGTLLKGELLNLISDIKSGELHSVYSYDQSRLERSPEIWALLQAECVNNSVDLYLGNEKKDLTDPHVRFFSNLLSLVNNFYSQITSEKLKATYKEKMFKCKTHGMLPYGFSRNEDNEYIINEDEIPIVKEIFRLAKIGYGTLKIAKILNQKGFKNRRNTVWQNSTVSGILKNKLYKGIKETYSQADVKDEVIRYQLPFKIIEPFEFDEINLRLNPNKKTKKSKYLYLLNDLIICTSCGNLVTGRYRERDRTYKCIHFHSHLDRLQCKDAFGVNFPKLDTFILHMLFNTKLLNLTIVESLKSNKGLISLKNEVEIKEKELIKNNKNLKKYYQLFDEIESDEIDNISIKLKIKSLLKIESELKNQIEDLNYQIGRLENNSQLKTITEATEHFKSNYEFSKLSEFVHSIIETIKIYRSEDQNNYLILIKLYSFDFELAYKTNKQLMDFEFLPFVDENLKSEFEEHFKHSFDEYFKEKVKEILSSTFQEVNSNKDKKIEIVKESGEDYEDDMNLFNDILKEEYIDTIYRNLSVHLKKDELIHFNDPIYKKPIEI